MVPTETFYLWMQVVVVVFSPTHSIYSYSIFSKKNVFFYLSARAL